MHDRVEPLLNAASDPPHTSIGEMRMRRRALQMLCRAQRPWPHRALTAAISAISGARATTSRRRHFHPPSADRREAHAPPSNKKNMARPAAL